ncbi:MAG TPA: hypothetical protein ENI97_15475 [Gammaproteobacteria bacterium]|nr:hypothetical protein [Gammaproteobacteria bacterium]
MKTTTYLIALSCLLASSLSLAGTEQFQGVRSLNVTPNAAKQPQVINRLNLKPDLVITSLGFNNEICTQTCSPQWANELGITRLNDRACAFQMIVKNQGNAASNAGKVTLRYPSMGGPVRLTATMSRLRAGESKTLIIPFNKSRPRYLYWLSNGRLKGKVDISNTSLESNEGNNEKSLPIRSFN